ncbi:ATPase [Pseudohalocynthiibacter aestuariivivens]|uniref:ATPase n=1 Tax=Roseovarius pelagicus TaxID=2980108 RepID=A0ABY6DIQ9_9RHOB|nr:MULTISPECIES: ATPase [Rhodobacterales]QIE44393.1 ATPase [Pseudohalocynthiibacter aestuariivivens]UXX83690.1 ATPase [Roseovarius pelagicus]
MIYETPEDWRDAPHKRVLFYGMSGLGKTHLSNMLRGSGGWFHYSIDYRIGTRYMGELIADNAKRHAMQVPFLRELLLSDSIYIGSNITFDNLAPVSTYLGKPGNPERGGLPIDDYHHRQEQFRQAEIAALNDTGHFVERAQSLYGYPHFICDTGGSICEWVDGDDPNDPLLTELSQQCLLVQLRGTDAHTQELIRRFDRAPKPMAYQPEFLDTAWNVYLKENNMLPTDVDPDTFIRWTYARALAHRAPRYDAMAPWGLTLEASDVAQVKDTDDFDALIMRALENRG